MSPAHSSLVRVMWPRLLTFSQSNTPVFRIYKQCLNVLLLLSALVSDWSVGLREGEERWPHDSHQAGVGRAHVGSLQTLAALHCCQTGRAGGDISPSPRPLQISCLLTGYNEDTVNTSSIIQYHHFDRYIKMFYIEDISFNF